MNNDTFLAKIVAQHDLVLLHALGVPAPQVLRAKVERIYSARNGLSHTDCGMVIDFVQAPGIWGHISIKVGERALVFMSTISGKLYEHAWRGHFILEEIDGELFAIYQHKELWLSEDVPQEIRANARQDPRRPDASAIRFNVFEAYLQTLIAGTQR